MFFIHTTVAVSHFTPAQGEAQPPPTTSEVGAKPPPTIVPRNIGALSLYKKICKNISLLPLGLPIPTHGKKLVDRKAAE